MAVVEKASATPLWGWWFELGLLTLLLDSNVLSFYLRYSARYTIVSVVGLTPSRRHSDDQVSIRWRRGKYCRTIRKWRTFFRIYPLVYIDGM